VTGSGVVLTGMGREQEKDTGTGREEHSRAKLYFDSVGFGARKGHLGWAFSYYKRFVWGTQPIIE